MNESNRLKISSPRREPAHILCRKMKSQRLLAVTMVVASFSIGLPAGAQAPATPAKTAGGTAQPKDPNAWPRDFKSGKTTFTVHQPQIEAWTGIRIEARAAVGVKTEGSDVVNYGVVWVTARTAVDKSTRQVSLDDVQVTRVKFPMKPELETAYSTALQASVPKVRTMSLDHLESELAIIDAFNRIATLELRHDPPKIIFSDTKAMLVYIDGQPRYVAVSGTPYQRVLNTRPLILKDSRGSLYLHLFDGWMQAASIAGPWTVLPKAPAELESAKKKVGNSVPVDLMEGQADPEKKEPKPTLAKDAPGIVVATEPTELVVTEGAPKFTNIPDTALTYVENTTGHIFRHATQQKIYVLISGRWFQSSTLAGPWEFVPGGKLPPDFKNIPDDSPKENVKASIPDTPQAQEAAIAASIPQTAIVKRSEAKLTAPVFDGQPQLKPIDGTSLQYVVNASLPIIQVDANNFYAVENGVWFRSASLKGPWTVTDAVPASIYSIPPSSPVHYVTYVRVYSSNKDTVTAGYTAGYQGSCTTHGSGVVVVYGTGYHYTPWMGAMWFGPPVTYGYGVAITYTPWTGWTFGYGFGMPPPMYGMMWAPYPYWGAYYRPVPYYGAAWGPRGAMVWGPGGWAATSGNVYSHWGSTTAVTRTSASYNAWTGTGSVNRYGTSYNSRTGTAAAGQRAAVGNVYTGNYAYGSRGVATNTNTGITAAGKQGDRRQCPNRQSSHRRQGCGL